MCYDEQRCMLARAVYSMPFIFCTNQLGTANTPNAAGLTATAEIAVVATALAIAVAAAMLAQHQQ